MSITKKGEPTNFFWTFGYPRSCSLAVWRTAGRYVHRHPQHVSAPVCRPHMSEKFPPASQSPRSAKTDFLNDQLHHHAVLCALSPSILHWSRKCSWIYMQKCCSLTTIEHSAPLWPQNLQLRCYHQVCWQHNCQQPDLQQPRQVVQRESQDPDILEVHITEDLI